jgi:hypothetical protein
MREPAVCSTDAAFLFRKSALALSLTFTPSFLPVPRTSPRSLPAMSFEMSTAPTSFRFAFLRTSFAVLDADGPETVLNDPDFFLAHS